VMLVLPLLRSSASLAIAPSLLAIADEVIEMRLGTSGFGTFRTCRGGLTMSVRGGKADVNPMGLHFRL